MKIITNIDKLRVNEVTEMQEAGKVLVIDSNNLVHWVSEDNITPDLSAYYTKIDVDAILEDYYDKGDKIPIDAIKELNEALGGFATTEQIEALANSDASNLSEDNIEAWKAVLGVTDLPENIGLIDSDGESDDGNVFTKEQINSLLQLITTRLDSIEELDIDFSNVGSRLDIDEELNLKLLNPNGDEISSVDLSGFVVEVGINFLEEYKEIIDE